MKKIFLAACLALAICAAFVPAASASPVLKEEWKVIAPGATVTAQNEGKIFRTNSWGNFICHASDMHGTVVKNTGNLIEIEFSSVTFKGATGGGCEYPGGFETWQAGSLPWCWSTSAELVDTFAMTSGKCGGTPKPTTISINGCSAVNQDAVVTGTYKTKTVGVGLKFPEQWFEGCGGGFVIDPITYNLTTATSPFTGLTIS